MRRLEDRCYGAVLTNLMERHDIPQENETAVPISAEHSTLYVAIEVSPKSWVSGIKSPAGERIGLHSLGPADKEGLRDLIEN